MAAPKSCEHIFIWKRVFVEDKSIWMILVDPKPVTCVLIKDRRENREEEGQMIRKLKHCMVRAVTQESCREAERQGRTFFPELSGEV
jgi:hypothetical protein